MANTIRFRRGSTVPSGVDFVEGEPAWDSTAGILYCKTAGGAMKRLSYNIIVNFGEPGNPLGYNEGDIWIRYTP